MAFLAWFFFGLALVFCVVLYVCFLKNATNGILKARPEKIDLGEYWPDDTGVLDGYDMFLQEKTGLEQIGSCMDVQAEK